MSGIGLRAIARIGKLSKELEKAEYTKGHGTVVPTGGKYKADQLAAAGLSTTTANRYEQLASAGERFRIPLPAPSLSEVYANPLNLHDENRTVVPSCLRKSSQSKRAAPW